VAYAIINTSQSKGEHRMKSPVPTLQKILNKAKISPRLQEAVKATIQALKDKDLALAYQITACKSYTTGTLKPSDRVHAFQEDRDYNEKTLKGSVYCILDNIHHDLAWKLNQLASGMIVVGSNKIETMTSKGTHPIVKRIIFEHKAIEKDVYESKYARHTTSTWRS
jgi:hypothetical protein